jgi:hypothetical protein
LGEPAIKSGVAVVEQSGDAEIPTLHIKTWEVDTAQNLEIVYEEDRRKIGRKYQITLADQP